jgi:hypothetical protein
MFMNENVTYDNIYNVNIESYKWRAVRWKKCLWFMRTLHENIQRYVLVWRCKMKEEMFMTMLQKC